jgi:DNA repair protein RecO (recombination protein O)
MGRNESFPAVILRSRALGESNRVITLLGADRGIAEAVLYGGPKSKLKSLAVPYHSGRAWIYFDPVRDSRKLSDFDPESTYPGVREKLSCGMNAALWAELLIRSRAGGSDFEYVFLLTVDCLKALEGLAEEDAVYASFAFIWRYSGLLGLRPDPGTCLSCAGHIRENEVEYYSVREGGFICAECRAEESQAGIPVPPGVRRYLGRVSELRADEAARLRLDSGGKASCKALVLAMARRMAEGELSVLETGEGML